MRAYENKQKAEGKPLHHPFMKEMLAAFAGAELDKLVETKGMDWMDRQQIMNHAHRYMEPPGGYSVAQQSSYGGQQQQPQYGQPQYGQPQGYPPQGGYYAPPPGAPPGGYQQY